MPESIENYSSQIIVRQQKKSAITAWSVGFSAAFVWVLLILLAPLAEAKSIIQISSPIYGFFSYLCHQIPSRTFHFEEHAFAVCTRCFGVYFGLLIGFVVYPLFRPIKETEPLSRIWLFLALIPIGIDWSLGVFDIWENTHWSRFLTGTILGMSCAVFILPALVEIFQLLSNKKQLKRLSG